MSAPLTRTDTVSSGDLVVLYKSSQGDYRGITYNDFLTLMLASIDESASQGAYTTQYSAPSATGFNIAITDGASNNTNVHLILTPSTGYAAGTITLPAAAGCADKQEVLVNCTQLVAALTIAANGATAVTGGPASLGADDFFRLKYDKPTSTWYRVG
jgi:hypothetical protein